MIWIVLLLATAIRLFRIDVLMRFIWDEGRDMLAIWNIIAHHDLTLFGPFNEIGGRIDFFGVFHYYLMLPSLWLSNYDPLGPAIFTALLGVAGIGLGYWWLQKWVDRKSSLAVATLLAVSPLAVRYTQWPWNPNTTGFFGILYLIALSTWQKKPKIWWAFIGGILLGLLFQLHYFTIALGAAALLALVVETKIRPLQKIWHASVFLTGFVAPNLSFVVFDITHAGFYRNILFSSFQGVSSQQFFEPSLQNLITEPPLYLWEVSTAFWGSSILGAVSVSAFVVFLGVEISRTWKLRTATGPAQLAVSWLALLAIISVFPSLSDTYHSAALWIGLALGIVLVFRKFWIRWPDILQKTVLLLLTLWLILQNNLLRTPAWDENMPQIRTAGSAIVQDVQKHNLDTTINVASFVDSDTRATRFRYFILKEYVALDTVDQYPHSDVLYVITPHDWNTTRQNPAWEIDSFREINEAAVIWNNDDWSVLKIEK